jgi:hypothetical protein
MTGRSLWVEVRTETCPLFAFAKRADKYQSGYVRSSELRRAISAPEHLTHSIQLFMFKTPSVDADVQDERPIQLHSN